MTSWRILAAGLACVVSLAPVAAQHGGPAHQGQETGPVPPQPFGVEAFGEFRALIMQGDFGAKLVLGHVIRTGATVAVGAVADARGEITIIDTVPVVSYGKPGEHPSPGNTAAALLVLSSTTEWQVMTVERDVAPDEIESYLAQAAGAHGIDAGKSFPFELRGTLTSY
jgi:hypothetical protein